MYKFYSFNENNVTAFQNYSAWFSKPNVFNNPFEGIYVDDTADISNEEFISFCQNNKNNKQFLDAFKINGDVDAWLQRLYVRNEIDAYKNDIRRRNVNILKTIPKKFYNSGICCFIMDVESNPISKNLMWGHYGNGLKGYAVEIIDAYNNVFESAPIFSGVSYEDTPPRINAVKIMMGMIKDDIESISDESLVLSLKIMNTKHTHWKYENELIFI
ncbi:DUF2971 domain-containing protein [Aeromonas salmonicida]|uniref:DUF2971 domain-containing protein n=2 Tax=Aeromonas salmonicida TaxID=645 RepID=UPI003D2075DD